MRYFWKRTPEKLYVGKATDPKHISMLLGDGYKETNFWGCAWRIMVLVNHMGLSIILDDKNGDGTIAEYENTIGAKK